jgi:hypothetical protein
MDTGIKKMHDQNKWSDPEIKRQIDLVGLKGLVNQRMENEGRQFPMGKVFSSKGYISKPGTLIKIKTDEHKFLDGFLGNRPKSRVRRGVQGKSKKGSSHSRMSDSERRDKVMDMI